MSAALHALASGTFAPFLRTLSTLLETGARHVEGRGGTFADLAQSRLAPDMMPLSMQVVFCCDLPADSMSLLSGRPRPTYDVAGDSLAAMQARIAWAQAIVDGTPVAAFDGADARDIVLPLAPELVLEMKGPAFLRDWTLPNFYFHLVTAYDILRHNGVQIGKRDYLAHAGPSIRRA